MGPGEDKPKTPDLSFRRPSPAGSSSVLHREIKVWAGGQGSFNGDISHGADQLQAVGGGEILVQVPEGQDARSLVQRFKGAVLKGEDGLAKIGRYRSITVIIVDPTGRLLLNEPLELPPSRIGPGPGPGGGPAGPGGGAGPMGPSGGTGPTGPHTAKTPAGAPVQTPGSTTVPAEEDVHLAVQTAGGGGGWRAAMAWGLAELVLTYLLSILAGKMVQEAQEAALRRRWEQLRPAVQADLDNRQHDIASLRQKLPRDATIHATVLLDVITIRAGYHDNMAEGYYGMNFVAPVTFGTEDVHGMGPFTRIDPAPGGNIVHRPLRVSFPVSVPAFRVLPDLAALHRGLVLARTRLAMLRGRTAGEAVALDRLAVAARASDYTAGSTFARRSNADRYAITKQHLAEAISALAGPGQDNADIRGVIALLRLHAGTIETLSSRWPAMDPA